MAGYKHPLLVPAIQGDKAGASPQVMFGQSPCPAVSPIARAKDEGPFKYTDVFKSTKIISFCATHSHSEHGLLRQTSHTQSCGSTVNISSFVLCFPQQYSGFSLWYLHVSSNHQARTKPMPKQHTMHWSLHLRNTGFSFLLPRAQSALASYFQ